MCSGRFAWLRSTCMEPKVLHRSMVGDILPARAALPHWIFGSGFQIAHYTLVRITQSGSVPQQPPTEDHEGARDTPDTHCVAGTGSRGPTALPDLRKRCGCVTTTSPVHHHVPTHRGFARTSTCTVNASHPTDVGCAKRRTCWNSDSTGPAAWIIRRHQLSGGGGTTTGWPEPTLSFTFATYHHGKVRQTTSSGPTPGERLDDPCPLSVQFVPPANR